MFGILPTRPLSSARLYQRNVHHFSGCIFAFSVVTVHEIYCNLCLRRNGVCEVVASDEGRGFGDTYNEQSAFNMVELYMNADDKAYIEAFSGKYVYGSKHSIFSGC